MFEVLLESHHVRPPRPVIATAISAVFHTALTIVLVGGTTAAVTSDDLNPLWDHLAKFLAPPDKSGGVGAEQVSFLGVAADGSPEGERNAEPVKVKANAFLGDAVIPQQVAPAVQLNELERLQVAAQAVGAFSIVDVDSAAERDTLSAAPAYPPEMLAKSIEGSATMQFVIDSTGLIDMGSITVMTFTHREFAQAVREAMPRMRFKPAMRGAVAVRQLVEQAYKFAIKVSATAGRTVKPG